jgi:hypothetical protein
MPTDTPPSTSALIPPAERASIAMVFVREALAAWRARGVDCAPLLLAAGIAPAGLADDGARVSPAQFGALWRQMAASLDDEFFGLADRPMKAGSFTLLCHSVLHAGVLQRALLRMLRFLRVTLDGLEGELRAIGKRPPWRRAGLARRRQVAQHNAGLLAADAQFAFQPIQSHPQKAQHAQQGALQYAGV